MGLRSMPAWMIFEGDSRKSFFFHGILHPLGGGGKIGGKERMRRDPCGSSRHSNPVL